MKTKVLLISLIGLIILFTITYKAYSDGCGYYFSWSSHEDCEMDCPNQYPENKGTPHVGSEGCLNCECDTPGWWAECRKKVDETCSVCYRFGIHTGDGCDYVESSYSPIRCEECEGVEP